MSRKLTIFFLLLLIAAIGPLYTSCQSRPMEFDILDTKPGIVIAGNPFSADMSNKIKRSVCETLTRCYSQLTTEACEAGVASSFGIASKLGLFSGNYDLFSVMETAEKQGEVLGNPIAVNPCSTDISALSCQSQQVINAYDPKSATPFAGVASIIPSAGACLDTGAILGEWQWAPVTTSSGLNFQSTQIAFNPWSAIVNSKLYMTWTENNSWDSAGGSYNIRVAAYNGNDLSPQYKFIDGSTLTGINYNANQKNISTPSLVSFHSKLYSFWDEGTGSLNLLRGKVYNGNDSAPAWTSIDKGGLNRDKTKSAGVPHSIVFNDKLYLAWNENNGTADQIRIGVYNSNDSAPSWSLVDGNGINGINTNSSLNASSPSFVIFNSRLYVTWMEVASTGNSAIRISVYNGNDAAPAWTPLTGLKSLNYSSGWEARNPRGLAFNNKLYLAWDEWNTGATAQIRVAVYNGNDASPSWKFVDGGAYPVVNWSFNSKAQAPQMIEFNSEMIMIWREETNQIGRIRAKIYNGNDLSPAWTSIDGNAPPGLNFNPVSDVVYAWNHSPTLQILNSKIYSIWVEDYKIFLKVGVPPGGR